MLTKTSLMAVRALLCLAEVPGEVVSPRRIAHQLGESPTYLSKVLRLLGKAGILSVEKGAKGGVVLRRPPAQITLLAIVEACQGAIVGNYCSEGRDRKDTCAFHQAAFELRSAMVGALARWNLARLGRRVAKGPASGPHCLVAGRPQPLPRQAIRQRKA